MKPFRKLRPRYDAFWAMFSMKHRKWIIARKKREWINADRNLYKSLSQKYNAQKVAVIWVLFMAEKREIITPFDRTQCNLVSQLLEHSDWDINRNRKNGKRQ